MARIDAGVGHSKAADAKRAGRGATARAVDSVGEPEIVYVFASSEYDSALLLSGVEAATDATVVGCTTGGEIVNTESYTQTVATLALGGEGIDASVGVGAYDEGSREAGRLAAERALDDHDDDRVHTEVVTQSDEGWSPFPETAGTLYGDYDVPYIELVEGLTDVVGNMTVTGGGAADDWKYDGSARVFHDGEVYDRSAVFAALDLDVRTGVGRKHGYDVDRELVITKLDGPEVLEFDGRPALEVYRDLYGPQVENTQFRITVPLGIDVGGDEERILTPSEIDEERGSMAFTGAQALEEGMTCWVMDPDGESVIRGAAAAIEEAMERAGDPDDIAAVLVNDCVCRWYFLSDTEAREAELDVIRERVGEDVPIAGLYTSGEFASPGMTSGTFDQTIVTWVISNEPL